MCLMKPVRVVCCGIRHLVLWFLCSPSTHHNRPLFTAPPTAIKHTCLSVSVCNHLPSLFFFFLSVSFFFSRAKVQHILSLGQTGELLFASFSLFNHFSLSRLLRPRRTKISQSAVRDGCFRGNPVPINQ